MVKLYEKLHRAITALEWFTTKEWKFTSNNVLMLIDQLTGKDKEVKEKRICFIRLILPLKSI